MAVQNHDLHLLIIYPPPRVTLWASLVHLEVLCTVSCWYCLHLLSISEEEILFVQHQWKSGKPDTEVIQWPNQKQTRTRTPHFLETVCDTYQNPTFTRYVDGTLCVE